MHIICVDEAVSALDNFRLTVASFQNIDSLKLFQDAVSALNWAKESVVDAAFLEMELPDLHGLELAKALRQIHPNMRLFFLTACREYALDAFMVDANGYILKPYTAADIRKELRKCEYQPLPSQRIVIQTIPTLAVTVDGDPLHLSGTKTRELFALLVDHGSRGLTTGEGIAYLWPDRPADTATQSLFRMTFKRLSDALEEAGIGHIIESKEKRRFLRPDQVNCDLYKILSGDKATARKYSGQYLREYSWAEERNGQLYRMLMLDNREKII